MNRLWSKIEAHVCHALTVRSDCPCVWRGLVGECRLAWLLTIINKDLLKSPEAGLLMRQKFVLSHFYFFTIVNLIANFNFLYSGYQPALCQRGFFRCSFCHFVQAQWGKKAVNVEESGRGSASTVQEPELAKQYIWHVRDSSEWAMARHEQTTNHTANLPLWRSRSDPVEPLRVWGSSKAKQRSSAGEPICVYLLQQSKAEYMFNFDQFKQKLKITTWAVSL